MKDDAALWLKYRQFGAGQLKLAFLKLDDAEHVPSGVTQERLETLANEDMWSEFLPIELGHWCGVDLRRMAEESDTKDIYDTYYGWVSGYVHSHWSAQRDSCLALCGNPLHRLHRVPLNGHRILEDVLPDAIRVAQGAIDELLAMYPGSIDRMPNLVTEGRLAPDKNNA